MYRRSHILTVLAVLAFGLLGAGRGLHMLSDHADSAHCALERGGYVENPAEDSCPAPSDAPPEPDTDDCVVCALLSVNKETAAALPEAVSLVSEPAVWLARAPVGASAVCAGFDSTLCARPPPAAA